MRSASSRTPDNECNPENLSGACARWQASTSVEDAVHGGPAIGGVFGHPQQRTPDSSSARVKAGESGVDPASAPTTYQATARGAAGPCTSKKRSSPSGVRSRWAEAGAASRGSETTGYDTHPSRSTHAHALPRRAVGVRRPGPSLSRRGAQPFAPPRVGEPVRRWLIITLGVCACGSPSPRRPDAGAEPADARDAGLADAGPGDGGHVVDGGTDAGLSDAGAFDADARLPVQSFDAEVVDAQRSRAIAYRVYFSPEATGPLPIAVFSHGGDGAMDAHTRLGHFGTEWASAGFLAIHLNHRPSSGFVQHLVDRPADVTHLLDRLATGTLPLPPALRGTPDFTRVAHGGHSYGATRRTRSAEAASCTAAPSATRASGPSSPSRRRARATSAPSTTARPTTPGSASRCRRCTSSAAWRRTAPSTSRCA
jgi:hypothetical protein